MWLPSHCGICEIFIFRTQCQLSICLKFLEGTGGALNHFSLFISSSLKMFNMQFQSNTLMLEVLWNISEKNCTSTFNPDFQNRETEMVINCAVRVDQVFGQMVIQRKIEVIYRERDSHSSALSVRMWIVAASVVLCCPRQYKYWYRTALWEIDRHFKS